MTFFWNSCNGGWKLFTKREGEPGRGEWFYNWGIFKVSLHSWHRTPPILLTSLLFKFWSPFAPTSMSPPNPNHTALSVVTFPWLNGWSCHILYAILFNDNMDLYMSSLGTLVPEGAWCVFYATRRQVYWGLTHNVVFYWYSYLISHTQTEKHTQHTQGPVDLHTHIIMYLHHLLCAHSSYLCYIKWLNE